MSQTMNVVPNSVVDREGTPRFGTYRGELPAVDLRDLAGAWRPGVFRWKIRRKRWNYTLVATDEVLVCQAVVDGGFVGQGFLYVVDLYEQRAVAEVNAAGLPGIQASINDHPGRGHHSQFRAPGAAFSLRRDPAGGVYHWDCRVHPLRQLNPKGLRLDAQIDPGDCAPALTVISPVEGSGVVNVTQKRGAVPTEGYLRVGSRSYRLDGALAGLDYTQGILSRRTSWRWAHGMGRLADGRAVGLNLVAGFNDGDDATNENALWIGDRLIPLGRAVFDFDPERPERYWTLQTEDGVVDAYFEPYFVYRDQRQMKVLNTHFLQPAGRFEVRVNIDGTTRELTLHGVTEHQDVWW